jgi:hypothetical protein
MGALNSCEQCMASIRMNDMLVQFKHLLATAVLGLAVKALCA